MRRVSVVGHIFGTVLFMADHSWRYIGTCRGSGMCSLRRILHRLGGDTGVSPLFVLFGRPGQVSIAADVYDRQLLILTKRNQIVRHRECDTDAFQHCSNKQRCSPPYRRMTRTKDGFPGYAEMKQACCKKKQPLHVMLSAVCCSTAWRAILFMYPGVRPTAAHCRVQRRSIMTASAA